MLADTSFNRPVTADIFLRAQALGSVRRLFRARAGFDLFHPLAATRGDTQTPAKNDPEGTAKPDGLGEDGTVPNTQDGVAVGHTGTASTFKPEEDELAE